MKKLISILLSTLLILPVIASFGITSAAESTYKELWAKKTVYDVRFGEEDGYGEATWKIYYDFDWNVLLYTKQGQKLSYRMLEDKILSDYGYEERYLFDYGDKLWYADELVEIIEASYREPGNDRPGICALWKAIQTLEISKYELVQAYQQMKESPESVKGLLPDMTEEEFSAYVEYVKGLTPPEDFIIEALCMEDQTKAHYLLTRKGAVYVPELGYAIYTAYDMVIMPVEEIAKFDLTTEGFSYYLANLRAIDGYNNRIREKMIYLEAAREAQLAAKETGDGAVQGVIFLALAIPALAATFILRRKRKI